MPAVGNALTFKDAELKAHQAAEGVLLALAESLVNETTKMKDKDALLLTLRELQANEDLRAEIETAFLSWLARSHTLLPPSR